LHRGYGELELLAAVDLAPEEVGVRIGDVDDPLPIPGKIDVFGGDSFEKRFSRP
jgi:hypothetical protein